MDENYVDLNRRSDESELAYIWRIGTLKDNGLIDMTWPQLGDILNKNLREPDEYYSDSAYRKKFSLMKQAKEEVFNTSTSSEELESLRSEKYELYKERVKLGDERRELSKLLREKAREEAFLEQIGMALKNVKYEPIECTMMYQPEGGGAVDLIVPLTDLHGGIINDNTWNKYDYDVLKDRLVSYSTKIREIQRIHGARNAYVCASEFISGVIHETLRLESNDNVIQQFVKTMNHVIWFLTQMSGMFEKVHVYVAPGNHSRIFPRKEENRKGENLDHLALYYLEGYLQNVHNVHFHENMLDEGIVNFRPRDWGYDVVAVHGDKDTPDNVTRHMSELLGFVPKIILMGHRHTNALISANGGTKVVQSGSVSGLDNHCIDYRYKGRAEQAVCVIDSNGLRCIYDIGL